MRFLVVLAAAASLLSSSPSHGAPAGGALHVDGQVFVVTKGQSAVKLPLVTIRVTQESAVARIRQQRRLALEAMNVKLASGMEKAEGELDAASAAVVELQHLNNKVLECSYLMNPETEFDACYGRADMVAARERLKLVRAQLDEQDGTTRLAQARRTISLLLAEHARLEEANDLFAEVRNQAETLAKTDADGKFSVTLPATGRPVLIAEASRDVAGETERYRWVVRVPYKRAGDRLPIMLANDNLISTGCADCMDMLLDPPVSATATRVRAKLDKLP